MLFILLSLIFYCKYLNSGNLKYLLFTVSVGSLALYSRASGVSFGLALLFAEFLRQRKINTQVFISLFIFFFLFCHFWYQWLFFGSTSYYLRKELFFVNLDIHALKFNVSELIFYIPSQFIYNLFGDKNSEPLLAFLSFPLFKFGKSSRFDLMGLLSVLTWVAILIGFLKSLKSMKILCFYFIFHIIQFIFHTCEVGCADPRIFLELLPLFFLFLYNAILSSPSFVRVFIFSFITLFLYLPFNLYGTYNFYKKEYSAINLKNATFKDIGYCGVPDKQDFSKAWLLYKLCFNKKIVYGETPCPSKSKIVLLTSKKLENLQCFSNLKGSYICIKECN
jgi:hypothetical protein